MALYVLLIITFSYQKSRYCSPFMHHNLKIEILIVSNKMAL